MLMNRCLVLVFGLLSAMAATAQDRPSAEDPKPVPPPADQEPKGGFLQNEFRGFKLAESDIGSLSLSLYTYVRYLNQTALEETHTDSFGNTDTLDLRQDIQLQKVKITIKGWFYDPAFTYNAYVWTSNPAQGQGAQVVGAGWLNYRVSDEFVLSGGIWSLPSVRTLEGSFPRFLKVDSRTIADEFFRGAYTSGIWVSGKVADGVDYRVMLANNLSTLGVDAIQLDNTLDTVSAQFVWMPTTGEYGAGGGYGDFDEHDTIATRIGLHGTRSTEDRQSQPGTEDPENTQVRLSDGNVLFDLDLFAPGAQVDEALYQMISIDAGAKYKGFALEGEWYFRWLSDFKGTGAVPTETIFDQGFQLQASYMFMPKKLMGFVTGSKIWGEHGDPWDVSAGVNWFPVVKPGLERQLRVSPEVIYVKDSPTGNSSVPYIVGSDGFIFMVSTELSF